MDSDFSGAPHAIELCSHLKCWDMFQRTAEVEGLLSLKERMRESCKAALQTAINNNDTERQKVYEDALNEWDEPDFWLWLKAKTTGYFG